LLPILILRKKRGQVQFIVEGAWELDLSPFLPHWEQGEEIAVDDLCQESPELAEKVRSQIRALKGTNWLFDSKDDDCDFLTLPPLETMVHADTVSIPASVSLAQFASCIVTSGLMTPEQLSQLQKQSAATNAQEFVNQLIRERKLTLYQAQAVVDGNTKGLVLGNYVILDRVGAGGMGQVFLAKHRIMKRVAAKETGTGPVYS
jgi:hypothetical protein